METQNRPPGVTLQITLAPGDLRHARHVLPHQLRALGDQVQEILCTLDTLPAVGKRNDDTPAVRALLSLVDECLAPYPHARRAIPDTSPAMVAEVGAAFIQGGRVPIKDWRGTAFYSYFYGWHVATQDYLFHVDSDMLFGGGSKTWVREAVEFLNERPGALACQPLMAPPTADGNLRGKDATREPHSSLAYRFAHNFSTQCFFLDKRRLAERVGPLELLPRLPARGRVTALQWLRAMPTWTLQEVRRPPTLPYPGYEWVERHIAAGMRRAGLYRVSLLGSEPGLWLLHPGVRTERVYELLPELIECVERGELPEEQRGRWNLEESTLDWLVSSRRQRERLPSVQLTS